MSQPPLLVLLVSLAALLPAPVLAAPDAGAPADRLDDGLDALVLRAQAAAEGGDAALSEALFGEAYRRQQTPEFLLHIGEACRRQAGPAATRRALRAYRDFLATEGQPDPRQQQEAVAAIHELTQRQAQELAGLRAGPDGAMLRAPVRGVAAAPDYQRAAAPTPAERLSLSAPARPAPAPAPRRAPPLRRAGVGLLGAGALLGAIGGVVLAASISSAGGARDAEDLSTHRQEHDRAVQLLGGGAACLGLGGAAVVAGGALLLLSSQRREGPALGLLAPPGGAGLSLGGTF